MEYQEIQKLYQYTKDRGVKCKLEPLYDGYKLCLPNNGDFVQHRYSYDSAQGRVEPAIGCDADYASVPLSYAMQLIDEYYIKN